MYVRSIIYIIEGTIVFIVNTLCFIAIFRIYTLRYKYIVILEQIASDALSSLGISISGIGRTVVTMLGIEALKSRRYCMLMPWNILFLWAETLTPVAMLTVSVDRLISVVFPVEYFRLPRLIQTVEVSVGCSIVAAVSVQSWILTFPDVEEQFPPVCLTSHSWQPFHDDLIFAMKVFASCGSVLVYVAVFVVSQKHVSRVKNLQMVRGQAALNAFQKRQRQLTISMGISCFFTVILYVLPTCIKYSFAHLDNVNLLDVIAIYSAVSSYLNPLANLAILFIRQVDIRNAICTCLPMRFASLCSVNTAVKGVSTHIPL